MLKVGVGVHGLLREVRNPAHIANLVSGIRIVKELHRLLAVPWSEVRRRRGCGALGSLWIEGLEEPVERNVGILVVFDGLGELVIRLDLGEGNFAYPGRFAPFGMERAVHKGIGGLRRGIGEDYIPIDSRG